MTDPLDWTSPATRIPRLGQHVQVLSRRGSVRRATFVVHHTEAWPSGAAWRQEGREVDLPFADIVAWAPAETRLDVDGRVIGAAGATPDTPDSAGPAAGPPAIVREALAEVEATRPVLLAMPDAALSWTPHPDLPTVLGLGVRLVRLVSRIEVVLTESTYDVSWPEPGVGVTDRMTLLREFESAAAATSAAVESIDLAAIVAPWTLTRDGATVMTRPRGDVLRHLALSPLVHVRGQFALYLQTLGVVVPPLYPAWQAPALRGDGPSASSAA